MKVLVIGACNVDIVAKSIEKANFHDSNPSKIRISFGGVGKNIAHNLAILGEDVSMLTCLSNDSFGKSMKEHLDKIGIKTDHLVLSNSLSSMYIAINDVDGDLLAGASDTDITKAIDKNVIEKNLTYINSFDYVVIDTNLTKETIDEILAKVTKPIIIDAVSVNKAKKLTNLKNVHTLKVNVYEASAISGLKNENDDEILASAKKMHEMGSKNVIISLGSKGILYFNDKMNIRLNALSANVVNSSGAGDALLAAITYGYMHNLDIKDNLNNALKAAKLTLENEDSVNLNLKKMLENN